MAVIIAVVLLATAVGIGVHVLHRNARADTAYTVDVSDDLGPIEDLPRGDVAILWKDENGWDVGDEMMTLSQLTHPQTLLFIQTVSRISFGMLRTIDRSETVQGSRSSLAQTYLRRDNHESFIIIISMYTCNILILSHCLRAAR